MLLLTACGGHHTMAPIIEKSHHKARLGQAKTTFATLPEFYKVKAGDTLYSIGFHYGIDYKTLADNNNITAPYKINIGQRLKIRRQTKPAKKKVNVANKPPKK